LKKQHLIWLLFIAAAYFPIFLKLDTWHLLKWDEARNAVNTLNMVETGDFICRRYNDTLDTWETKPPLLLWFQAATMSIVGENTLGVRLPSALATLALAVLMILFCGRTLKDWKGGFFAAGSLLVSDGFIKAHVSRTGDHDALLSLWLTLSIFYFYKWLINKNLANALKISASVTAAVLTKSIMGLLFLPGLFLFLVVYLIWQFSQKKPNILRGYLFLLLGILAGIIGISSYYILAEITHQGYLQAVWKMELLPRFMNVEGKYLIAERGQYLKILYEQNRFPFWAFLPLTLWLSARSDNFDKKLFIGIPLSIAVIFSLIMSYGVWYDWYDAPLYPLWALIFGLGLSEILSKIQVFLNPKNQWTFGFLFVFAFFALPYRHVVQRVYDNFIIVKPNEMYGITMTELKKTHPDWRNYTLLYSNYDAYDAPMQFYQKTFNHHGFAIEKIYLDLTPPLSKIDSFAVGKRYLSCHPPATDTLMKHFETTILYQHEQCVLLEITKKRE
jgi:4-amino-4-deoxy-L-arabinose transferase-like glycosyltransferase